jgi:hypothetical protein
MMVSLLFDDENADDNGKVPHEWWIQPLNQTDYWVGGPRFLP